MSVAKQAHGALDFIFADIDEGSPGGRVALALGCMKEGAHP
jgi:hypothetical protein